MKIERDLERERAVDFQRSWGSLYHYLEGKASHVTIQWLEERFSSFARELELGIGTELQRNRWQYVAWILRQIREGRRP